MRVVGAFGAAVGIVEPPDGIEPALLESLVDRTVLDEVDAAPEAFVRFGDWAGQYTAEVWSGTELLRRHVAPRSELLVDLLVGSVHHAIARHAKGCTFVHAGAVAVDGTALLLPGSSHAGKTSLVVELLRAGAGYLSDEFAVIDDEGNVLPYTKPLSVRSGETSRLVDAAEFGASAIGAATAPGLVVFTAFEPSATFDPEPVPKGSVLLGLIANSVTIRDRPADDLPRLTALADRAVGLRGPRGEASGTAGDLLRRLDRSAGAA